MFEGIAIKGLGLSQNIEKRVRPCRYYPNSLHFVCFGLPAPHEVFIEIVKKPLKKADGVPPVTLNASRQSCKSFRSRRRTRNGTKKPIENPSLEWGSIRDILIGFTGRLSVV